MNFVGELRGKVGVLGARDYDKLSSEVGCDLVQCFAIPDTALAAGRPHAGVGFGNQDQRKNGRPDCQSSPKERGAKGSQRGLNDEAFHNVARNGARISNAMHGEELVRRDRVTRTALPGKLRLYSGMVTAGPCGFR